MLYLTAIILGLLTIASSLGVLLSKNPLNSALNLIVTLILIATHFAILNADFVAVMQVLVYAGAIMVLVVFVIMLLGLRAEKEVKLSMFLFSSLFVGLMFFLLIFSVFREDLTKYSSFGSQKSNVFLGTQAVSSQSELGSSMSAEGILMQDRLPIKSNDFSEFSFGSVRSVADFLFYKYIYGVQIVALLLLSSLIGAVLLAKEPERKLRAGRGLRAKREEG